MEFTLTTRKEQIESEFAIISYLFDLSRKNISEINRRENENEYLENEMLKRVNDLKKKFNVEFRVALTN